MNPFFFRKCIIPVICFTLLLFGHSSFFCYAQSQFDTDDDDVFVEDESSLPGDSDETGVSVADRFLDESTFTLGYRFSYGTGGEADIIDNTGYLRLEYDTLFTETLFFKFDGRGDVYLNTDHRAKAEKDSPGFDGSIREAFLQAGFENFSLKIGHQVNIWGKADTAAITDVVSPRDNSQFIFTTLENSRLGQFMVSGNFYWKDMTTHVFLTPHPEIDEEPGRNSRYDRSLGGTDFFKIETDEPRFGDLEYGIKVDKTIAKTDASMMAGHFYSNAPVYAFHRFDENFYPVIKKQYPDYTMAGAAVSHAWQRFLFKLELAYKHKFPLQGITSNQAYACEEKNLVDSAVGIEYNANDKYQLYLEISNRYIFSDISTLLPGTHKSSTALYGTFVKDFLNQTLNFEYSVYFHPREKSQVHQLKLIYDLTDSIEILAEYAWFNVRDENSLMWLYRDEDRLTFEMKYFF